jgi:hypothetical protein
MTFLPSNYLWPPCKCLGSAKIAGVRFLAWCVPAVFYVAMTTWPFHGDLRASDASSVAGRSATDHPVLRDTKRVLKARQALYEDPLLAPYNLAVESRDDAAILSGTLPDAALALRAQEQIRKLGLFKDVRSDLLIDATCAAGRSTDSAPLPAQKFPTADTKPGAEPVTSRPLSEAVTLLPPRPIDPAKKTPTEGVAVILSPRAIQAKDPSAAIEQLRRSEARYLPLQVTVRDGVVTVRGARLGEDMFAFAEAARRLPGVIRVVLDSTP